MDAPLCRVCNTKHWGNAHAFKVANVVDNAVANKSNGETPLDQPAIPVASQGAGVDRSERRPTKHGRYADPEKRRAYMRDLMRKRRQLERSA